MNLFLSEFIGTATLILLGNGVVSNVVLQHTKGFNSGWIVIAFGWAIAVFSGVIISAPFSGAHLNPAVTLAMAVTENIHWNLVPSYILAQFSGAIMGQILVWLAYKQHFDATMDAETIRACFCNSPAIRQTQHNLLTESIGTFVLVITILFMVAPTHSLGALNALPVALLVLGIGLSLGGPTGYAINPARDLGPRIVHAFLPLRNKGANDWDYAWIPVAGPLCGGLLAAFLYQWITNS
ncbi:MAG: aquaporin family protein [Saprospiraceae bacterium]|jgi:glycerol uptake facilitator protein|nr:aquaporin family protein [Saprospiraceae bacterium]